MAIQQSQHTFKGMQRDLAVSKFNPEYFFEAHNIRITAREKDSLFSITNEKGPKELLINSDTDTPITFEGVVLGYSVLNNYVVIFTKGTKDNIYKVELNYSKLKGELLYSGNLNFSVEHPIEALSVYENEDIQKVYWVDGKNQTRVINIAAKKERRDKWTESNNPFDFIQEMSLQETISIQREDLANGLFSSGIIQYAFTYYNQYGQETNIFNTTPIEYISFPERGASPEEKLSTSFKLTLKDLDTKFDYVRIYSIHRTSIDATPTVTNVVDLIIGDNTELVYIDNGTTGKIVDPTSLLFIGGDPIIFKTIAQKDNTLFLGNAFLKRQLIDEDIRSKFKGGTITYLRQFIDTNVPMIGTYPYENSLKLGSKIKGFKSKEWYRFGIQFQHKTGKFSEPIFINDTQNTDMFPSSEGGINVVNAYYRLSSAIIDKMVAQGYVRARGVIVYPTLTDREVVLQGILCPTVFNVSDRFSNSPFAQSSWFSRPTMPYDINKSKNNWASFDLTTAENSKAALIRNDNTTITHTGSGEGYTEHINLVARGAWAEFRHNRYLPGTTERNAEIQCNIMPPASMQVEKVSTDLNVWVTNHSEFYGVDQSILTMHSPDIEFDDTIQQIDTSRLKLRLVGSVPITGNASDIDIQVSTPQFSPGKLGFYKGFMGSDNKSIHGMKSLIAGAFWFDNLTSMDNPDSARTEAFFVYPWHRNGSLNDQGAVEAGKTRTAMLDKKKISNLKFSTDSGFFREPWLIERPNDSFHTGISGVTMFTSKEQGLVKIPAPKNSGLSDLNYYGNIDKVVNSSRYDSTYKITTELLVGEHEEWTPKIFTFNRKNGYPIMATGSTSVEMGAHKLFTGRPVPTVALRDRETPDKKDYSTDAVRIKYKSTPHAVIALNWTKGGYQTILPTALEGDNWTENWKVNPPDNKPMGHFFWNPKAKTAKGNFAINVDVVYQDILTTDVIPRKDYGFFYLAELYNDNVVNRFGGQTDSAFENNQWLPAGKLFNLIDKDGTAVKSINIFYTEGDTYYGRYDCVKTYPYTLEDQNSITEIVSFMCETKVNLDGRYDRNRGQVNNLAVTPENFNKINKVYNQKNSFFNYRGIDYSKFSLDYFPNAITWTKEKQLGNIIDDWTNINMSSVLDLDGDKGEVVSLNAFNNEIFCFQREALSNIIFNSRVQIPTSDGVPIEISNGMKVQGKRYISNTVGCDNKWSIQESPMGLYFLDNITNSIYLFNGQLNSLSDRLGFRQFVSSVSSSKPWDPQSFENCRTFYDKNNNDVYFVFKDYCLCYSELLGQFTSFLPYDSVPAIFNLGSQLYSIKNDKLWEQFEGDYNIFYGKYQPFSVTVIGNLNPTEDKVFNNIEYRADSWSPEGLSKSSPFTHLKVWNEYQEGEVKLTNTLGKPSPLKKKFRVWRANIPRDKSNNRDRIRNTWSYIKLSNTEPNTERVELHDLKVNYTF